MSNISSICFNKQTNPSKPKAKVLYYNMDLYNHSTYLSHSGERTGRKGFYHYLLRYYSKQAVKMLLQFF